MNLFIFLTALRLVVPFSILRWPLVGILLSILVDLYDWQFFPFTETRSYGFYQNWDKVLDVYYWLFAVFVLLSWRDRLAKRIALFLFVFRVIGIVLFFMVGARYFLFFFPNIFENFFIFYLAFVLFTKNARLITSKTTAGVIILALLVPKLVHEYFMHFLITQPWEIWDYGARLGFSGFLQEYTNYLMWGSIFHILPVLC